MYVAAQAADAVPPHARRRLRGGLAAEAPPRWARGLARAGRWLGERLDALDYATDLAENIGSARWWRGLGVLAGLTGLALAALPGLRDVAPLAMPLDRLAQGHLRAVAVIPLAPGDEAPRPMAAGPLVSPVAAVPDRPSLSLTTTLGANDTLPRLLLRAGATPADAQAASAAIARATPLEDLAPGTAFTLTLGHHSAPGTPRALDRVAFRAALDEDLVLARQGGAYTLIHHPLLVDQTPLRLHGTIGEGGFYRAALAAGVPPLAIQQYLQAMNAHLSLDDVRPGARFDLILAYARAPGAPPQAGALLYAGLEGAGAAPVQLLRWGGEGQFFDANDMASARQQSLIMPVAGARITSAFGWRFHPILGYERMHSGVDLAAPWGSPIYAVADGLVTWAGWHGGHGNYVKLEHGGGVATGYGHMSRFVVAPGGRVRAGQVIGYVGATGLATGPHLHYEVFRDGRPVDPMSQHFTVRAGVDKAELAAFRARLARLLLVRPGAALAPLPATSPMPTGQFALK